MTEEEVVARLKELGAVAKYFQGAPGDEHYRDTRDEELRKFLQFRIEKNCVFLRKNQKVEVIPTDEIAIRDGEITIRRHNDSEAYARFHCSEIVSIDLTNPISP